MESSSFSHHQSMTQQLPTWKMYENPLYTTTTTGNSDHQLSSSFSSSGINNTTNHHHPPKLHILHLPVSARKIAASFWDLSFIKPFMESQIFQLKAELERERRSRKKAEFLNKKLGRELSEERKTREGVERAYEELAGEISWEKEEMYRLKREMEEERKMMRTAEIFREERVRMKLAEARVLMEEKLDDLGYYYCEDDDQGRGARGARLEKKTRSTTYGNDDGVVVMVNDEKKKKSTTYANDDGVVMVNDGKKKSTTYGNDDGVVVMVNEKNTYGNDDGVVMVNDEKKKSTTYGNDDGVVMVNDEKKKKRRGWRAEGEGGGGFGENPHIRRGIKGLVEFQKVMMMMSSSSSSSRTAAAAAVATAGSKTKSNNSSHLMMLECQREILLLNQRRPSLEGLLLNGMK